MRRFFVSGLLQNRTERLSLYADPEPKPQPSTLTLTLAKHIYSDRNLSPLKLTLTTHTNSTAAPGIRVNCLCPGYFKTELNADYFESEAGDRYLSRIPPKRLGWYSLHSLPLTYNMTLSHWLTQSLAHSVTRFTALDLHPQTYSLTYSLTQSRPLTYTLIFTFSQSLTHLHFFTYTADSLTHSLTDSFTDAP